MISVRMFVLFWLSGIASAVFGADVELVKLRPPDAEKTHWVGQRIALFVELRAKGSFEGTSSFSLPQIPQTVFLKIGNPTVTSEEHDGDSWFVQTHEFALFTQAAGTLAIPEFSVRFSNHDGFTGPVTDHDRKVPAAKFEVQSPPNRDSYGFLVTTDSIEISEAWNPEPGKVKPGDIVVRTITQSASQMTGMALEPPANQAPSGVQIYPSDPIVLDKTDRGDFTGERTDKITYRFQRSGTMTIPEATYTWWDPDKQAYGTQTLPAVVFNVAAIAQSSPPGPPAAYQGMWRMGLVLGLAVILLIAWKWRIVWEWINRCWQVFQPPDRVAARLLLRACRTNDAQQAEVAWAQWQATQSQNSTSADELYAAVEDLHRSKYAAAPPELWNGKALSLAFQHELRRIKTRHVKRVSVLPKLNPQD
ncbi:BatD family protein [Aureliella helgolandensis]|uniref:DUF7939 domain-containing protein n=1 Tax=Aureliella helgolandensis TaxID=2527968 RepID=A0A518G1P4_9BACT|nr:BatD family protein [Aureliella helgolandensis]QDV22505.1 hypothetical protein Q31a_07910 [Aureliella helgolandensis]